MKQLINAGFEPIEPIGQFPTFKRGSKVVEVMTSGVVINGQTMGMKDFLKRCSRKPIFVHSKMRFGGNGKVSEKTHQNRDADWVSRKLRISRAGPSGSSHGGTSSKAPFDPKSKSHKRKLRKMRNKQNKKKGK